MENIKLFTQFDYLVGNLFLQLNKVEVKVYFIYQEAYIIKLPLFIKKIKNKDKSYYVAEAKKIIARMIEDGSLKKYSDEYIKEKKRKKFLLLLLLFFGIGALAGASVGIYFACKKPATYDVSCATNGITINNSEAIEGEDYSTQITFTTTESVTLPHELDKVLINGKETSNYTYTLEYGSLSAKLFIPAQYVTGKIEIFLTPSVIEKWYLHDDWWNYCSTGVEGEEADEDDNDIGREVDLTVNGQIHKVRLIGLDHDELSDGSGVAHTTFQFSNLLCDENGYSFGVIEDFDVPPGYMSRSYDYPNSKLRKNLTGKGEGGEGGIMWFQRGEVNRSQEYINTTVMDMLPKELKGVLKEVKKIIYTDVDHDYEYDETYYDDKLFVPTFREMFNEGASGWEGSFYEEGTTYNYYLKDNPSRIFNQISDDSYTEKPTIEDIFKGVVSPHNYAGYCSGDPTTDTNVIFASPLMNADDSVFGIESGTEITEATNNQAFGITPCFCI